MEWSFPWIEIRQLRSFPAVAEAAGFARAATRGHKTRSVLSTQIRQLERHVGTELFVRGRHQISLAAAGRCLASRPPPSGRSPAERSRHVR
jgi:DNA-binding transcriptional LysR family regulator